MTASPGSKQLQGFSVLQHGHWYWIMLSFIGFGLLLAFTPCSLPMLPILASIIVGQKKPSLKRSFALTLTYVLSMALTYAAIGLLFSRIGQSFSASLQKPWVIVLVSCLFIVLALSLLGCYRLRLPKRFNQWINRLSDKQKGGRLLGVACMGVLATLVVSPCITPALFAALSYIGSSGNLRIGSLALFSLGLGMGIPLLIAGTLGGNYLPKAGRWMQAIERLLAAMLVALALWLLDRILPNDWSQLLWSAFAIMLAVYLGVFDGNQQASWQRLRKGIAVIALLVGGLGLVKPITGFKVTSQSNIAKAQHALWQVVDNQVALNQQLAAAKLAHKPAIVDFYADWCIECKLMDKRVFSNPKIVQALQGFVRIRADVTAQASPQLALQKTYGVIAPPSILFFNRQGKRLTQLQWVGSISTQQLQQQLAKVDA